MQWCDASGPAAWRPPAIVAESPSSLGGELLPLLPTEGDLNVLLDAVESVGAIPLDDRAPFTFPPLTPKQYSAGPVAPSFQPQSMRWGSSQLAAASVFSSTPVFEAPSARHYEIRERTRELPAPRKARRSSQCQAPDCFKTAWLKGRCAQHGGGVCCAVEGSTRADQSHSNCKIRRDGTRCSVHDCSKTSQDGDRCRRHGRGKLCGFPGCTKAAQWEDSCFVHVGARVCLSFGCAQRAVECSSLCAVHCKTTFQ